MAAAAAGFRQVIRQHIPLIKFPVRRLPDGSLAVTPTTSQSASASSSKPSEGVIDDRQLPLRFMRKPLDPLEIAYINRGGPE